MADLKISEMTPAAELTGAELIECVQGGQNKTSTPFALRSLATNMDLQAANPVDYGYKLLEASGEFPDATWNV